MSLAKVLRQVGSEVARDQVQSIQFRSQISPAVQLDPFQEGPRGREAGFSEAFLRFTKPAFYVHTKLGTMKMAPWGEPKANYFPLLAGGVAVAALVVGGLALRGLVKR